MTDTPTDSPAPPSTGPRKVPSRGSRKRVLGDGEGDYCIYQIMQDGNQHKMPRGSLVPIPNTPRFVDSGKAKQWIAKESGDRLVGMELMIFKACEILSLVVDSKPRVIVQSKLKITVEPKKKAETSNG